jgi:hypothetical protein
MLPGNLIAIVRVGLMLVSRPFFSLCLEGVNTYLVDVFIRGLENDRLYLASLLALIFRWESPTGHENYDLRQSLRLHMAMTRDALPVALSFETKAMVILGICTFVTKASLRSVRTFLRLLSLAFVLSIVLSFFPWYVNRVRQFYALLLVTTGSSGYYATMYMWNARFRAQVQNEIKARWTYLALHGFHWMLVTGTLISATPVETDFLPALRSSIVRLTSLLKEARLPTFIRSVGNDRLSAQETIDLLRDIGYPLDEFNITKPTYLGSQYWDSEILFGTNWSFKLPQYKVLTTMKIEGINHEIEKMKHSSLYFNAVNEIRSTARYFNEISINLDVSPRDLDCVWEMLKPIYANSQITPLKVILRAWHKKYNVGPFAMKRTRRRDPSGTPHYKKLKRKEDIARFTSEDEYLSYWERLIYYNPIMQGFSSFFPKEEYIKKKKWLNESIRTPVSTYLPQYLSQVILGYEPDHRGTYDKTPVKTKMPLNGHVMSTLWDDHARFDFHFEGDCVAFDSQIDRIIVDKVIVPIRQRGYRGHNEYTAIAELISTNYRNLLTTLLVSATTGNVYKRAPHGLGTGHASTSGDNSMVMVALYMLAWSQMTGMDAHAFRHYNCLSVYGDDHMLSISKFAPQIWNFKNISRQFKRWGMELKLESGDWVTGTPLGEISFLSKTGHRPSEEEKTECRRILGYVPNWIITHNMKTLIGKGRESIKQNPLEAAKRLRSMLDLTAHRPDAYKVFTSCIHQLQHRHSHISRGWPVLPTYSEVVTNWHKPHNNISGELDPVDEEERYVDSRYISSFGVNTTLDEIAHALAIIPDFLNPRLYDMGLFSYICSSNKRNLRWPDALLAQQNGIDQVGALNHLRQRTCYDFLPHTEEIRSPTANAFTLLARHWCFLWLCPKRFKYKTLDAIQSVTKSLNNANFMFNARVMEGPVQVNHDYFRLGVVILLNYLVLPDVPLPSFLLDLTLPSPTVWLKKVENIIKNRLYREIPASLDGIEELIKLQPGEMVTVSAPPGAGKSTDFINSLNNLVSERYSKLIVIEPRALLVLGLVKYMRSRFGDRFSGATSGLALDQRADVWYITPQEFFVNKSLFENKDYLYVIDEGHLDETFIVAIRSYLKLRSLSVICCTATVSPELENDRSGHLEILLTNIFTVSKVYSFTNAGDNPIKAYMSEVLKKTMASLTYEVYLIFVPTIAAGEDLIRILPGSSQLLMRGVDQVLPGKQFYVATSVVDVGITIPFVTYVMTMAIEPRRSYPRDKSWQDLPQATKAQRAGRTGRTNHGVYHEVVFSDITCLPKQKLTTKEILAEWMGSGAHLSDLYSLGWLRTSDIIQVKEGSKREQYMRTLFEITAVDEPHDVSAGYVAESEEIYKAMVKENPYIGVGSHVGKPINLFQVIEILDFMGANWPLFKHTVKVLKQRFEERSAKAGKPVPLKWGEILSEFEDFFDEPPVTDSEVSDEDVGSSDGASDGERSPGVDPDDPSVTGVVSSLTATTSEASTDGQSEIEDEDEGPDSDQED